MSDDTRRIEAIEVVGDRTDDLGPDEGFLRYRRLTVRNRYADGSTSESYPCDVVSRLRVDAVAVVQSASDHGERTLGELVGGSELAHPFITTTRRRTARTSMRRWSTKRKRCPSPIATA